VDRVAVEQVFFSEFFFFPVFPLLMIIPQLLHTHLSLPSEVFYNSVIEIGTQFGLCNVARSIE
jgi:hypothetical protein